MRKVDRFRGTIPVIVAAYQGDPEAEEALEWFPLGGIEGQT